MCTAICMYMVHTNEFYLQKNRLLWIAMCVKSADSLKQYAILWQQYIHIYIFVLLCIVNQLPWKWLRIEKNACNVQMTWKKHWTKENRVKNRCQTTDFVYIFGMPNRNPETWIMRLKSATARTRKNFQVNKSLRSVELKQMWTVRNRKACS